MTCVLKCRMAVICYISHAAVSAEAVRFEGILISFRAYFIAVTLRLDNCKYVFIASHLKALTKP